MSMRDGIKSMIMEVMNGELSEVGDAVFAACDEVDEVMDVLEEVLANALSDLSDQNNIESVKDDLERAYDKI